MSFVKDVYNLNADGSVRAEFVVMGHGVVPLGYFARSLGLHVADVIEWRKSDLRGLLLNAEYVNDCGQKCDKHCAPVEDESFAGLPDRTVHQWSHRLWVKHSGTAALTDKEWADLNAEDRTGYRQLNCMKIYTVSRSIAFPDSGQLYITEEAVSTLAEMLVADVFTGDPIMRRYQHECKTNEVFAAKFGFALDMALDELYERSERAKLSNEENLQRLINRAVMSYCGWQPQEHRITSFGKHCLDDNGNEVTGDNE